MNQGNRNCEDLCITCKTDIFSYIVKTLKSKLVLFICEKCYKNSNNKDDYISLNEFKEYQMQLLKKAQPYLFEILTIISDNDYQYILTEEQIQQLMENKNKVEEIINILTDVEEGILEQINQLLYQINSYLQEKQLFEDILISLKFGLQMKHLDGVDKYQFQKQQMQFFEKFRDYHQIRTSHQMQNQSIKEIYQRIQAKDDFPLFLQIVGKNFQQVTHPNEEYYGFYDDNSMKTGIGFWSPKQQSQQYFGIFYQNVLLWGIKILNESPTQYTLYEGFFSSIKGEQGSNIQINCAGEMFSKDENEQFHHYQGNFLNEKRHGKGTYIWKANEQNEIARYSGFWQNNQYHGYGTLTLKEENIIIEGEFSFGQPVFQKCQIKGPNLPQQTLKDYVMKEQTKKSEENIIPKQQFNVNQFFQPTQNLQQFQKKFNEPFNSNGFPFNPNNQAQYSRDFQNNQNAFNQNNYFKK